MNVLERAYKYLRVLLINSKNWYNIHKNVIKNHENYSLTKSNFPVYNLTHANANEGAHTDNMHQVNDEEIKNMVEKVLKETDLNVAPIAIVSIANFYGFSVYEMPMDDSVSGLIMADDKNIEGFDAKQIIVVNSKHSSTRKRFTIAHELGHYFIQNKPSHCFAHRDAGNYSLEERYANNFASTLLMPEDEIIREVGNFKKTKIGEQPDSELINYIANEFDVSQSAAAIRLKKLHII
jgi:hypothetical protein